MLSASASVVLLIDMGVCLQASQDAYLELQEPTWGLQGPFAFNIWLSQGNKAGDDMQYVLSSRNPSDGPITDTSIFLPNQVILYGLEPVL